MRYLMALCLALMAFPAAATDDRQAIVDQAGLWSVTYAARDLDALMALYEPDAWVMLGGQPALKGREAVRAYFAGAFAGPAAHNSIDLAVEDVRLFGDIAQLVSLFRVTAKTDGASAARVYTGRSLLLYRKGANGRWRIWRDIDNSTPDATAKAFKDEP